MTTNDPRLKSRSWKRLRLFVLERDRYECQIRGPKCTQLATEVDHIESRADGGDFWALDNLRAACAPCNRGRGTARANARRYRTTLARYATRL